MESDIGKMTVAEFALYLKKKNYELIHFHKDTSGRRNLNLMVGNKSLKQAMKRRFSTQ